MEIYKIINLWYIELKKCKKLLIKFNNESNIKSISSIYKKYVDLISEDLISEDLISEDLISEDLISEDLISEDLISEKNINIKLLNLLDLIENLYFFLKKNISYFLNDNIISYLKHQKSFSYSNNLDNLFSEIKKCIINTDIYYMQIKKIINNSNYIIIKPESFSKLLKRKSLSLFIYLKYFIIKKIKITKKQKYQILNVDTESTKSVKLTESTELVESAELTELTTKNYKNFQLIHYPINSIYKLKDALMIDFSKVISIFPDYIKYNIDPLINKKYENDTIFSALSINIVKRLKIIEKFSLSKKYIEYDNQLVKNYGISLGKYLSIIPAKFMINDDENNNFYPFGGLNNYTKKYLTILENIILKTIKMHKINPIKKEIESINYNLDNLKDHLIKEFKIHFYKKLDTIRKNNIEFDYLQFFNIVVDQEYNDNLYIAKALHKIHNHMQENFLLSCQMVNSKINIDKFEKEFKINQLLTIYNNGVDIWISIKNEFIKLKLEKYFNLDEEEQNKELLLQFKLLINRVIENKTNLSKKTALECITITPKLYGIIYEK
jgi:hypothetical protein